jgi:ribosomal protein S21
MINEDGLEVVLNDGLSPKELEKAIKKLNSMVENEKFERKDFHETKSQRKRRKRKENQYLRDNNVW